MNFLSKLFHFLFKDRNIPSTDNTCTNSLEKHNKAKFSLTESENALSENFYIKYYNEIIKMQEDFYKEREKIYLIYDFNDRVKQYNLTIDKLLNLKKFCLSHGKGGRLYFSETWEHCFNSHNPDFSVLENLYSELNKFKDNKDLSIIQIENEKKSIELKKLKSNIQIDVLDLIKNNPGIFQKDVYKHFDSSFKSSIQHGLTKLNKQHKIIKIKQGNTYKLYMKEYIDKNDFLNS